MTLLERIENHLRDNDISATTFGREAVGDPRFVLDLRKGRNPRRKTVVRLEAYLAQWRTGACACRGKGPTTIENTGELSRARAKAAMIEKFAKEACQKVDNSRSGEGDNR